jgi:CheY-like chemotaxis protein
MVATPPASRRVLLIEDDFLLRELVTMTLAGEGYMVATARDGEDAFQRLRHYERPHLILLDLMMPGMDGWCFRRRQKEDPELARIPVVVISAVADVEENASSLGASGYLQKPVETGQLLEVVRRCCGLCPGPERAGKH